MRIHLKLIRFFISLCPLMFFVFFILNWLNLSRSIVFDEYFSFAFLNTVVGGIMTSSFVVLLGEVITYSYLKKETIIRIFQAHFKEYTYYQNISLYIEQIIKEDKVFPNPIDNYSEIIYNEDCDIRDIDYDQLFNNHFLKMYKEARKEIELNAFHVVKLSKQIIYYADKENTVFTNSGYYTPTEPIMDFLLKIKKHVDVSSGVINKYMSSLDYKKIFHWRERRERLEQIPLRLK